MHWPYSDFTSLTFTFVYVYVYLVLWNFIHVHSCNYHYIQRYRTVPSRGSILLPFYSHSQLPHSSPSLLLATTNLFFVSITLSLQECYMEEVISYVTFGDCFFSLSIIFFWDPSKLLHVSVFHSFYCWVVVQCMKVPQFVKPFIHWRTSGFCIVFGYYE